MDCFRYAIYACTTFGLFMFFPWGIVSFQSDWSLSCDHGLDYVSDCENNNNKNNMSGTFNVVSLMFCLWSGIKP